MEYDPEFLSVFDTRQPKVPVREVPHDELIAQWAGPPFDVPDYAPTLDEIDRRLENVPVSDGKKIEIQIDRPRGVEGTLPLFFVMHGGGWMVGTHSVEETP